MRIGLVHKVKFGEHARFNDSSLLLEHALHT